jgi:hypothetical protein
MGASLITGLSRRLGIDRPTCLMGLAFLFACLLPIVIVKLTGEYPPVLAIALNALFDSTRINGHDSWRPIGDALRYLDSHPAEGLYQATYWQSENQFIYSPLSLVICRLTDWPPLLDWKSEASLNAAFRFVMFADIALMAVLFNDFYRMLRAGSRQPGRMELAARIVLPIAAGLLFFPLMNGYAVGNVQTGLTFLILLSLAFWLRGYQVASGVCLGLVCLFKPALAPIMVWALLRREYRLLAGFVGTGALVGLISLWMFGWGVHQEYLTLMSQLSRRGESFYGSHSINSLLNRAVFNGPNLVWDGTHSRIAFIPWIHYATSIAGLCFIGLGLLGRRQDTTIGSVLDYVIALLCIHLASPVLYEHHIAFTLVLFMLAGVMVGRDAAAPGWMLWALGIGYFLMANFLEVTDRLAQTPFNFLQSYRLFSCLILLLILWRLRAGDSGPAAQAVPVMSPAQ